MPTTQQIFVAFILVLLAVLCLLSTPLHSQLFRPFSDGDHRVVLLEGNWQSCREADGTYAERVYEGVWAGLEPFEFHMGPKRQFALFKGIQAEHREHDWSVNLLKPVFDLEKLENNRAGHVWDFPKLGLRIEVKMAGGSSTDCESWYVTIKRSNIAS